MIKKEKLDLQLATLKSLKWNGSAMIFPQRAKYGSPIVYVHIKTADLMKIMTFKKKL